MGLFKRVSKHVRVDDEMLRAIDVEIARPGEQMTFSDFMRNAAAKELIRRGVILGDAVVISDAVVFCATFRPEVKL
jgi:hypothetical protein